MVDVDKAVIARLASHGSVFEILVDPVGARKIKEGYELPLEDIIATREVYKNARKGDRVPEDLLNKVFGSTDIGVVAREIIKRGEIQLTAQQREEIREKKRNKIATIISRNAINPQTSAPHPLDRILRAMEEARVNIDIFKRPEEQVEKVIKQLRPIIPLKFEKRRIAIKIPPDYAGRLYNKISSFGKILQDDWQKDGSWICVVDIPAGLTAELFEMLANETHGSAETKILGAETIKKISRDNRK